MKIASKWHASGYSVFDKLQPISRKVRGFCKRLFLLKRVLTKRERQALTATFIILLLCGVIKFRSYYLGITKAVPADNGTYTEGLIGQPEFINPVLAKSDNDKLLSGLIYEGLVDLDNKNQATPKLATSWEVSADQKTYTFHLRSGVTFQDGKPLNSDDVRYTYSLIQDASQKSPLLNDFKDVTIDNPDAKTVVFTLKTPYGAFLTNLTVGIIPGGQTLSDLDEKPDGTGDFKYQNSSTSGSRVGSIILDRYDEYWGSKPYFKRLTFKFFNTERDAVNSFDQEDLDAIPANRGTATSTVSWYETSGKVELLFNEGKVPFNDKNLRVGITTLQKPAKDLSFEILVSDTQDLVKQANDFKSKLEKLGYKPTVTALKEQDFKARMDKKDFQAIIVGVDFGHNFDPYPMWHSSQIDTGLNLAGFNNKPADILLESARQLADPVARGAKYDEFNKLLDSEAARVVLSTDKFYFSADDDMKNVSLDGALTPSEHLRNLKNWYIKTKRVRK